MLGERSDQRGLSGPAVPMGRESFYGQLVLLPRQRPGASLGTALLLQSHDKVSDSKARADFDLRWKALGIEAEDRRQEYAGAPS